MVLGHIFQAFDRRRNQQPPCDAELISARGYDILPWARAETEESCGNRIAIRTERLGRNYKLKPKPQTETDSAPGRPN